MRRKTSSLISVCLQKCLAEFKSTIEARQIFLWVGCRRSQLLPDDLKFVLYDTETMLATLSQMSSVFYTFDVKATPLMNLAQSEKLLQ